MNNNSLLKLIKNAPEEDGNRKKCEIKSKSTL